MTSLKKTLALVIALPLALGSASALAYGGGKHHKDGGKHGCGMQDRSMFRALNLTDAQKDEMKALRQANHRSEMQAQHQKMQQLVLADNFDEAAVRDLAKTMSEQQIDRRVAMLKQRHDMMQILTPEQKTQYQTLQAERMEQCQAKMAEKYAH